MDPNQAAPLDGSPAGAPAAANPVEVDAAGQPELSAEQNMFLLVRSTIAGAWDAPEGPALKDLHSAFFGEVAGRSAKQMRADIKRAREVIMKDPVFKDRTDL